MVSNYYVLNLNRGINSFLIVKPYGTVIRTLNLEDLTWNSFSATYNFCDLITYIKGVAVRIEANNYIT